MRTFCPLCCVSIWLTFVSHSSWSCTHYKFIFWKKSRRVARLHCMSSVDEILLRHWISKMHLGPTHFLPPNWLLITFMLPLSVALWSVLFLCKEKSLAEAIHYISCRMSCRSVCMSFLRASSKTHDAQCWLMNPDGGVHYHACPPTIFLSNHLQLRLMSHDPEDAPWSSFEVHCTLFIDW